MTRTTSSWLIALVRLDNSGAAAAAEIGSVICQPSACFVTVVATPDSWVTFTSSILPASTEVKTFSSFEPLSSPPGLPK
jgi:hypothetical protein